jgi:hypothetical protein
VYGGAKAIGGALGEKHFDLLLKTWLQAQS